MTPSELRRAAKRGPSSAHIISDGSRDYFVEIRISGHSSILCHRNGKPQRFRSLAQARDLVRQAKVTSVALSVRVAADEACAGQHVHQLGFAQLTLTSANHNKDSNSSIKE